MQIVNSTSETVLAVDIGTSGVRAALITSDGSVLAAAQRFYSFQHDTHTGFAEMDADVVFDATAAAMKQCTTEVMSSVRCVSMASAMHSLLLLDHDGQPLTPFTIWADTRAKKQCVQYRIQYDHNHWHRKTGCILSPSLPLARLLWYRDNEPNIYKCFTKAVSLKSYLFMRLTNACVEDHSVAAGSGLLNILDRRWEPEVLDYIGLDSVLLPELAGSKDVVYRGRPKGVELDGISSDTLWIAGGADGPLAHRASTGKHSNAASLTIGTSTAARLSTTDSMAERPKTVWCYPLDSHRYVVGQASNNGGTVIDWGLKTFFPSGTRLADLDEVLRNRRPDPGLFFVPYLHEERDCLIVERPSAGFFGLRPQHGPLDLFRAVLEGVLFNAIEILKGLGGLGNTASAVVSGSVSALHTTRHILAALLPETRHLPEGADATLRGAAGLGWEHLGIKQQKSVNDAMRLEEGSHGDLCRQKYERWKKLHLPSLTLGEKS